MADDHAYYLLLLVQDYHAFDCDKKAVNSYRLEAKDDAAAYEESIKIVDARNEEQAIIHLESCRNVEEAEILKVRSTLQINLEQYYQEKDLQLKERLKAKKKTKELELYQRLHAKYGGKTK